MLITSSLSSTNLNRVLSMPKMRSSTIIIILILHILIKVISILFKNISKYISNISFGYLYLNLILNDLVFPIDLNDRKMDFSLILFLWENFYVIYHWYIWAGLTLSKLTRIWFNRSYWWCLNPLLCKCLMERELVSQLISLKLTVSWWWHLWWPIYINRSHA